MSSLGLPDSAFNKRLSTSSAPDSSLKKVIKAWLSSTLVGTSEFPLALALGLEYLHRLGALQRPSQAFVHLGGDGFEDDMVLLLVDQRPRPVLNRELFA